MFIIFISLSFLLDQLSRGNTQNTTWKLQIYGMCIYGSIIFRWEIFPLLFPIIDTTPLSCNIMLPLMHYCSFLGETSTLSCKYINIHSFLILHWSGKKRLDSSCKGLLITYKMYNLYSYVTGFYHSLLPIILTWKRRLISEDLSVVYRFNIRVEA